MTLRLRAELARAVVRSLSSVFVLKMLSNDRLNVPAETLEEPLDSRLTIEPRAGRNSQMKMAASATLTVVSNAMTAIAESG